MIRSSLILTLSILLMACGGGSGGGDSQTSRIEIQNDDIVSIADNESISVYLPADDQTTDYVSYHLFKDNDSWRLGEAHLATRKPGTAKFSRAYSGFSIVNGGEWSRAVMEAGAADFVGGYHGYEVTESITLDDSSNWNNGRRVTKELKAETESVLFRHGTDTPIADVKTTYNFTSERLEVAQTITWREQVEVETAYLSMLPIKRQLPNGEQITDIGYRSPDYEPEDILTDEFPVIETVGTRNVRVEGSWSDIVASISITELSGVPEPRVFISNSAEYNKVYFGFSSLTQTEEEWKVVTRYSITK